VASLENNGPSGPPSPPAPSDLAAFAMLRPWAVKMARYLGARPVEEEDITQEALLLAARDLGSFLAPLDVPRETALRRWIVGILAHVLEAHRDHARRHQPAPHDPASVDPRGRTEARAVLRHLLQTFPSATTPERWRVWLAREVDGVPVAEIARQEGAPESTIYNRLRLARVDLAAMLAREEAAARGPRGPRKRKG
jgi:RNA polymerase sigma factor (sigma-70 family)